MKYKITKDVKVSVEPSYEGNFDSIEGNVDVFSYQIIIENKSNHTIKLLKRHWLVLDAADYDYEIEGNGVIGEQPILCPGEKHIYESGSQLKCPIGAMKGSYLFKRLADNQKFHVEIPHFNLLAPFIAN
ncbi:MAG: Co2+/Mg2+ efflux protein ApaG [Flavobacteriales bacterium]|nr:Co2+/Mg2+ efflux protein ApaG [Flavobacteriales bacterium]